MERRPLQRDSSPISMPSARCCPAFAALGCLTALLVALHGTTALDNGLAVTPPMGCVVQHATVIMAASRDSSLRAVHVARLPWPTVAFAHAGVAAALSGWSNQPAVCASVLLYYEAKRARRSHTLPPHPLMHPPTHSRARSRTHATCAAGGRGTATTTTWTTPTCGPPSTPSPPSAQAPTAG